MFYKLFNVPANFQNYINTILAKKFDIFIIVYLDEILIYNKNLSKDHIEIIRQVLVVLERYRFFINMKKCLF